MNLNELDGRIAVFGANMWGCQIASVLRRMGKDVSIYDNDNAKQGKKVVYEMICLSPSKIQAGDFCIIAVRNDVYRAEIRQQLNNAGEHDVMIPTEQEMSALNQMMNDEDFIRCLWYCGGMDYELNLDSPKTLCEKLQWLKLYNRNPEYTKMVDKYEAKEYVASQIGEEYIVPLYQVWNNVDDIDIDKLPNQFVLKCTHDSGTFVVCKDKKNFDIQKAREILRKGFEKNYFYENREWVYKNVKPRIIAEKYIDSLGNADSVEYKVTCMNGKVEFVTICTGIAHVEFEKRTNDSYDIDFNHMPWYVNYKNSTKKLEKPALWDELIEMSEKLARDIPYVRVDFYIAEGKLYFGEMTFYTWSGIMKFTPSEWDRILGDRLILP